MAICFEADCGYGPLYDKLASFAPRVVTPHSGQLTLIFRTKRNDAGRLATRLYLDQVPATRVPSIDARQWRELIQSSRRMVDRQTTCKNQIRALLRGAGVAAAKGLWPLRGLSSLKGLECTSLSHRPRPRHAAGGISSA